MIVQTHTYINAAGFYVPAARVPNSYFARLHSKPEEWFVTRTGIRTRSRASEKETLDYMSVRAVEAAARNLPFAIGEVDLIVQASYSPDDTVGTTAHRVQRHFGIDGAKVLYVSSACSSAVNGLEIIRSFFASGIATKALLIAGDRNSTYSDDNDPAHGHLWGDGVVAWFLSTESHGAAGSGSSGAGRAAGAGVELELLDIETRGLGHIGAGAEGVYLRPRTVGIGMPGGKDVFTQACTYMEKFSRLLLERNSMTVGDLDWFVSHQANQRIVSHVCREMDFPMERTFGNIEELGNTGCGSSLLALTQNMDKLKADEKVILAVFGGGYSVGAALLEVR